MTVRPWILALAAWIGTALFRAGENLLPGNARNFETPSAALFPFVVAHLVWFGLSPLAVRMARRYPIRRPHLGRDVLAHVLAAGSLSVLQMTLLECLVLPVHTLELRQSVLLQRVRSDLHLVTPRLLTYAAIVLVVWWLNHVRASRAAAVRLAALESEVAEARLGTLRTQLNPPFFFGTLDSVKEAIFRDQGAAAKLVVHLGDLLRLSLHDDGSHRIALSQELRNLDPYLSIVAARREGLSVETDVAPEARAALVPSLVLQGLVEHVLPAPPRRAGRLALHARAGGGTLVVTVSGEGAEGEAGALAALRERIARLYEGAPRVEVTGSREGVSVELTVPLVVAAA